MNGSGLAVLYILIGFIFGGALLAGVCLMIVLLFTARVLQSTVNTLNTNIASLHETMKGVSAAMKPASDPAFHNAADTFVRMAAFWPSAGRLIQQFTETVERLHKGLFNAVPEVEHPLDQVAGMPAGGKFYEGMSEEEQAQRDTEADLRKRGIEVNETMAPPAPPNFLRVKAEAD